MLCRYLATACATCGSHSANPPALCISASSRLLTQDAPLPVSNPMAVRIQSMGDSAYKTLLPPSGSKNAASKASSEYGSLICGGDSSPGSSKSSKRGPDSIPMLVSSLSYRASFNVPIPRIIRKYHPLRRHGALGQRKRRRNGTLGKQFFAIAQRQREDF